MISPLHVRANPRNLVLTYNSVFSKMRLQFQIALGSEWMTLNVVSESTPESTTPAFTMIPQLPIADINQIVLWIDREQPITN
jgi:hypothetical protein